MSDFDLKWRSITDHNSGISRDVYCADEDFLGLLEDAYKFYKNKERFILFLEHNLSEAKKRLNAGVEE